MDVSSSTGDVVQTRSVYDSGSANEHETSLHPFTYKGLLPHSDNEPELGSGSVTEQATTSGRPANSLPSDGSKHKLHKYLYHSAWVFERHRHSGQIPCTLSVASVPGSLL